MSISCKVTMARVCIRVLKILFRVCSCITKHAHETRNTTISCIHDYTVQYSYLNIILVEMYSTIPEYSYNNIDCSCKKS